MDEFLRQVRGEFGLSEEVARRGLAVVLRHLTLDADRRDVRAICDAIPGASRMLVASEREGQEGHRDSAVRPLDPKAGVVANLEKAGIAPELRGPFTAALVHLIRERAPRAIVDRRVAANAELGALTAQAGR